MARPTVLEATVSSRGRITLPKRLRERLGLERGSRIRFRVDARGRLHGEPMTSSLEDLWTMVDRARRRKRAMSSDDMDSAKARRRW